MVHIFQLVLILLYHKSITDSRDLHCALYIGLEIYTCVEEVAIGE